LNFISLVTIYQRNQMYVLQETKVFQKEEGDVLQITVCETKLKNLYSLRNWQFCFGGHRSPKKTHISHFWGTEDIFEGPKNKNGKT
jgi:hypothetical protein